MRHCISSYWSIGSRSIRGTYLNDPDGNGVELYWDRPKELWPKLRSLYFALAGIEIYFTYLKYGLAAILVFVGVKMCIADFYKMPVEISLIIISFLLVISMIASVY